MRKLYVLTVILTLAAAPQANAQGKQNEKSVSSSVLSDWMNFHCRMVRLAKNISHVAYSRHFAYSAIAVYESMVHGAPAYLSLSTQLNGLAGLPAPAERNLFWPASVSAAYASMLRHFYGTFPGCEARIDSMEVIQEKQFALAHISQSQLQSAAGFGKSIASSIIEWAEKDEAMSTKEYRPLGHKDLWTPVLPAAAPFWAEKRPLTKGLDRIFSLKPPSYGEDTATDFYRMANEVYTVSAHLTPEQKATALYWDDSPNGQYMTVFGHWTSILAELIRQRDLPLAAAAEAYAKMSIAMHEATILAWKGKYGFRVLRPASYIQEHINRQWQPLIATPPHPEFPAAHATFSTAAATALCSLLGEHCAVTDVSYTDIGMQKRHYASLRDVAREAGLSRLFGGIHYRYSIEQGALLGESAANWVSQTIRFHK